MMQEFMNMFANHAATKAAQTIKQMAEEGMDYLTDDMTVRDLVESEPLLAIALTLYTNSDLLAGKLFDELEQYLPELPEWYTMDGEKALWAGTWSEADELRDMVNGSEPFLRLSRWSGDTYELRF